MNQTYQRSPREIAAEIAASIQLSGLQNDNVRLRSENESLIRNVDRLTQQNITAVARISELKTVLLKFTKCFPVRMAGRALMREGERKLSDA